MCMLRIGAACLPHDILNKQIGPNSKGRGVFLFFFASRILACGMVCWAIGYTERAQTPKPPSAQKAAEEHVPAAFGAVCGFLGRSAPLKT